MGGGSTAAIEWSKLMGTNSQDIVRNPQENCKKVMFGEQITHFLKKKTPTNCNSGKNKQNRRQWMLYSSFVIMIDFDKGRLVDCKKKSSGVPFAPAWFT